MAVKHKYKKVYKGVRYLTNKLRKNYPKKYKTRADASVVAKELYTKLIANGSKVTLSNAKKLIPKKDKVIKNPIPVLPDSLLKPIPYYNLHNYPNLIESLSNNPEVYFESNIIPKGLPNLVSGYEYYYSDYFRPYVHFIDRVRKTKADSAYEHNWFVRCEPPSYNHDKKHWVSKIISCDVKGVEDDYGFDNSNPDNSFDNGNFNNATTKKDTTEPIESLPESKADNSNVERELKLELKLELEKQRTELFKMFSADKISKEFFEQQLKRIDNAN